jgi:iron complex outermembrane recepter protein
MSKINQLSNAIKFALFVGASASMATASVFAQEEAKDEVKEIGRVEVTGSRIKRVDTETSQPVFVLTKQAISEQGLTSIGDVIQNLSANGSTLNTTFNNGGNGETRVSLRNLGSNRTLVLVNGRRWVGGTGLGGAVDLNTIPTSAVERIEVLKDGASTLYGSDAIAGVVNVVLKKNYEGAEVNAYLGQYSKGDGTRQSLDVTIGSASEDGRFNTMLGASYVQEDPVSAGAREISSEPVFGTGVTFGSSTTPFGRFALCAGTVTNGVCSTAQTRPDGSTGQFTYNPGQQGTAWRNFVLPADFYNFAPDNYLATPQERISTFARGTFQITDNVSFDAQLTYNNRKSEQLLAAMPISLGTAPGTGVQARQITISQFNQYNPFGQTVSRIQRRAVETGGRSFKQNVDTFGFSGALEGSFELGERFFTWDAGMVFARNDQNDTTNGLFNVLALRNALGPSRNGICYTDGTFTTAIPGCVPLNLLGAVGTITPEMLGYSTFVAHDELGYEMRQYFANVSGELFELPGGTMGFAFGLESRKESGFDQPDALINSGNTTGNARTATSGEYSLDEAYLELAIPVLKDMAFAKSLEFSLASRYSDYSNFGNTTNSKFGFKWKPVDSLLVRGNWSEGFRAPSINELFQGVSDSFPQVADPCNNVNIGALTPEQRARCVGVPAGGYDQGNPQIRTSVGGNPNLRPETSKAITFGFVWAPEFIKDFDVSLDYWKIDIEDTINTFGAQFILDQCIEEGFANFCSLFSRNAAGEIDNLLSAGVNSGANTVSGLDLTMNYKRDIGSWGNLAFNWDTTYTRNNESDQDGDGDIDADDGGSVIGEYQDRNNNWKYRSNLSVRWSKGDFGASLATRFYSDQIETCGLVPYGFGNLCSDAANDENRIGSTTYHDIQVTYKAPWDAKVSVGINNAFDKDPPVAYSTFANSFDPNYEIPGRFWYMKYEQKF